MRRQWPFAGGLLSLTLLCGAAYAGSDPATAAPGTVPAPSAPRQGDLPLVLSIRALSVGQQAPFADPGGEVERVTAPTGAGTSRWPSATTQVGRGVYITVMPACIPGVDEPLWPAVPRGRRR
jgi:hypothetical protein